MAQAGYRTWVEPGLPGLPADSSSSSNSSAVSEDSVAALSFVDMGWTWFQVCMWKGVVLMDKH